jgi:putative DNA primase/helicase
MSAIGIDFAGIRAAHPIADTIGRYLELKRRGGAYVARCPFHNDSNPSLEVVPRKSKAFCNACNWHGDVIDFVAEFEGIDTAAAARKLSGGDLPTDRPALPELPPDEADEWQPVLPAPAHAPAYDPAKTYNPRRGRDVNWKRAMTRCDAYRSADGQVLGYVVRMEIDGQKLTPTVTWARHADGREAWVSGRFPNPRPLQGLDDLAGRPDVAVMVVSGEKCRAVTAETLPGFVAVTWAGGDQNVARADWRALYGRRVTLWPDADDSGREAAQRLAALLHGHAAEVRVIDTADMPKGWDIADAVADGWDRAKIIAWAKPRVSVWAPDEPPPGQHQQAETETAREREPVSEGEVPELGSAREAVEPNHTGSDAVSATGVAVDADPEVMPRTFRVDLLTSEADDYVPVVYGESNIATRFAETISKNLRYVDDWGRWMVWDGRRWQSDRMRHAMEAAKRFCAHVSDAALKDGVTFTTEKQKQTVASRFTEKRTIINIADLAKSDPRIAASAGQWDADPWLLNTPAGVVDLRTGQFRSACRNDHMTKITHVAPGGDCPTWLRFLDTATAGDAELIAFLQRMAGYALTGSTRDHALFFVYGTGGNGKGTFLNTLQWIMGDYARAAPADMFTERKHEAHTTELARLMGARLVAAQETEEGKRWAEAKIKALTGGDPVTARFMRQDDFEFMPQFKLVMTGNHKPGLRNVDEAIKRRLYLIPFTVTIPAERRDTGLADRLRAEAGGILAWAVAGCQSWLAGGLRAPSAVLAATNEYLEQQDVLAAWIDECCEESIGTSKSSSLYASYKAWSERAGEFALPMKRWSAAMEGRGFQSKRMTSGVMYAGLRIKSETREESW